MGKCEHEKGLGYQGECVPCLKSCIVELEAEQKELVYDCRDHRIAKDKALEQLADVLKERIRIGAIAARRAAKIIAQKRELAELRRVLRITADDLEQSEGRKEWADELRTALRGEGNE